LTQKSRVSLGLFLIEAKMSPNGSIFLGLGGSWEGKLCPPDASRQAPPRAEQPHPKGGGEEEGRMGKDAPSRKLFTSTCGAIVAS
jgi:hypothetical protein